MRIKSLLAIIFAIALLTAAFSACSSWMPAEETGPEPSDEVPSETAPVTEATTEEPTEPPTSEEPTTKDPLAGTGITELDSYAPMPLSKESVMDLYKQVLDDVKLRCPGFTRKQEITTQDVKAGEGKLQLANNILNLVATEMIKASGDAGSNLTVPPHSDLEVKAKFPAYGETVGCTLENYSIIKSASAYTDGKVQVLKITVEDAHNAEPGKDDFSKIMTPISRENFAEGAESYVPVFDKDDFKYDFDYTQNEITCEIDAHTGRILTLTQKNVINVDVDMNINLFFIKTSVVKATGTIINRWTFSDFVWD